MMMCREQEGFDLEVKTFDAQKRKGSWEPEPDPLVCCQCSHRPRTQCDIRRVIYNSSPVCPLLDSRQILHRFPQLSRLRLFNHAGGVILNPTLGGYPECLALPPLLAIPLLPRLVTLTPSRHIDLSPLLVRCSHYSIGVWPVSDKMAFP